MTPAGQERAILVGLDIKSRPRKLTQGSSEAAPFTAEESLEELQTLAESAGAIVEETMLQSRAAPDTATLIGTGKIDLFTSVLATIGLLYRARRWWSKA